MAAELLEIYSNINKLKCRVDVSFRGEDGIDFDGLTQDLYTTFWNNILNG